MWPTSNRRINILLWLTGVLAVLALLFAIATLVFVVHNKPEVKLPAACTTAQAPCIALVNESGQVFAKVNDFRFGPQGCIYYRVTTADQFQEHCGGYTMQWIGPGTPPGKAGTV
jgi:hypothetical protein